MIRILICDDHVLIAEGIELMLDSEPDIEVVKIADTGKEAVSFLRNEEIDILILDLSMPNMNGVEVLNELERLSIQTKVLILTMHDRLDLMREVMKKSIYGYVLKNTNQEKLIRAIKEISDGRKFFDEQVVSILMSNYGDEKSQLTEREKDILNLLVQGKKTKEIADMCFISVNTVLSHKKNIYSKLNVHSVSELINYTYKNRI